MAEYYDGWENRFFVCPGCAWVGYGKDTRTGGQFRDLFERDCPECPRTIFTVTYPTVRDCKGNLEKMTDTDRMQLEARERFLEAAAAAELLAPEQLPELPGDEIVLAWDRDYEQRETVIRHGPIVVWREVSYYEGYERFREVLRILARRYGTRLLDLIPTVRSMNSLFGDRMSAPDIVDRARFDWDGERQQLLTAAAA
jgi:hypothetical protein